MKSRTDASQPARVGGPDPMDFYNTRGLLDDDERQVQDTVGRFVDERVIPIIGDAFDAHRFPAELIPEIAELGLLGCNLEGYGCAGLSDVVYGLVCQELERGDSGLRSFVSVHGSLCMWPIHTYGSDEQKERWLPAMAKGEKIGCFGLTESDGGSDPSQMRTHAKRDGSDWVISGAKMWITNGSIADVHVIWAETDEGVRGFLVEKDMPGYTTRDILKKYSLRASITSELFLDSVRVPESSRLPGARGLGAPLSCLTQARYGITWGAIGAAIDCFAEAREFAGKRILFGRPLAKTQTVQRRLADMSRRITLAQLLSLQLGRFNDAGKLHKTQVSIAKWKKVRNARDIARDARDHQGAGGISVEFHAIRHMLNLESVITYEGTETIHELSVGRELTGHAAF
jgi:glutaryl-CoA dehydrogenase